MSGPQNPQAVVLVLLNEAHQAHPSVCVQNRALCSIILLARRSRFGRSASWSCRVTRVSVDGISSSRSPLFVWALSPESRLRDLSKQDARFRGNLFSASVGIFAPRALSPFASPLRFGARAAIACFCAFSCPLLRFCASAMLRASSDHFLPHIWSLARSSAPALFCAQCFSIFELVCFAARLSFLLLRFFASALFRCSGLFLLRLAASAHPKSSLFAQVLLRLLRPKRGPCIVIYNELGSRGHAGTRILCTCQGHAAAGSLSQGAPCCLTPRATTSLCLFHATPNY